MNFLEIQKIIENFCEKIRADGDFSAKNYGALPLSDALFCAEDRERNAAFFRGILAAGKKLPKNFVAIDAGAGLGILGIFAIFAGAKTIFFLEKNPETIFFAQKLFAIFGKKFFQKKKISARFFAVDARHFRPPKKFDFLISETISSGFCAEDFPKILFHLKKFAAKNAIFCPEKFKISAPEISEKIELFSKTFPAKKTIFFDEKIPKNIFFEMTTTIFENEKLKNTASFGNARTFETAKTHPIFDFVAGTTKNPCEKNNFVGKSF